MWNRHVTLRWISHLALVLLIGAWLSSCKTLAQERFEAGQASKVSAEATYKALYRGAEAGTVPRADAVLAEQIYDAWMIQHNRYISAARHGEDTELIAAYMKADLQRLIDLAIKNGVW